MQALPPALDHPVMPLMLQWFYGAVTPIVLAAALMGVVLVAAYFGSRRPGHPLPPELDDGDAPAHASGGATAAQAGERLRAKIAAFNACRSRVST